MKSNFLCPRCGFVTERKDNFKRHLGRKLTCKAKLKDISINNILKYFKNGNLISIKKKAKLIIVDKNEHNETYNGNNNFVCSVCHCSYKHKSSYNRHFNTTCRSQNDKSELNFPDNEKLSQLLHSKFYDEYLTLKFEQLKTQHMSPFDNQIYNDISNKLKTLEKTMIEKSVPTLAELMSKKDTTENKLNVLQQFNIDNKNILNSSESKSIGDNNQIDTIYQNGSIDNRYQNNQQNITNNIYINDFGKEDTKHISKRDWKKIINKFYQAIPTLVEKVHIENEGNQNVFIPSIKDNYALVYEKDDWQIKALTQVLEDIIVTNADRLYDFINENQGEIDERTINKLDTIMEQLGHDDVLYKKYQREIKYLLLNNRNLIRYHYEKHSMKPLKHR
jgi:hypothetical protein